MKTVLLRTDSIVPAIRQNWRSVLCALWLVVLSLILLAACTSANETPLPSGLLPSTPVVFAPTPGETRAPTPAPSASAPVTTDLIIWLGDDLAPTASPLQMQILTTALNAFQVTYPATRINIYTKKSSGKGGIEDLLISTQAALPQSLPDIVTLDLRDLPRYAKEGVLQPFEGSLAPAVVTDLYPFARQAGVIDARQFAMPFTADVLQVVYDNTILKSPPLNWTELYTNGIKYAFAAGDASQVSDSFLAQYVALGGRFVDTRGRVALDRGPLRDALDFYRNVVSQSVAISNTLSIRTLDDSFRMFTSSRATLADVSARTFMRELPQLKNAAYGSIPTREGNLATISRTWGMALVAAGDPNRRVMAQRLIEYLAGVEIAAAWNRAAGQLPVRRTALGSWSNNIAYRDFINQLLSVAVNRPPVTAGANLDGIMQAAVVDVLNNGLSPADAADKAIAALNR